MSMPSGPARTPAGRGLYRPARRAVLKVAEGRSSGSAYTNGGAWARYTRPTLLPARPTMSDPTLPPRQRGFLFGTWLFAVIAQFLIATNPGYFSHDELGWGVHAEVAALAQLPWQSWTDVAPSPWRPLTFNVLLVASWLLFDTPMAWHVLWVAI